MRLGQMMWITTFYIETNCFCANCTLSPRLDIFGFLNKKNVAIVVYFFKLKTSKFPLICRGYHLFFAFNIIKIWYRNFSAQFRFGIVVFKRNGDSVNSFLNWSGIRYGLAKHQDCLTGSKKQTSAAVRTIKLIVSCKLQKKCKDSVHGK